MSVKSFECRKIDEIRGNGIFSLRDIKKGERVHSERPLFSTQHPTNRFFVSACHYCCRFIGNPIRQMEVIMKQRADQVEYPLLRTVFDKDFCSYAPRVACDGGCGFYYCSQACKEADYFNNHNFTCSGKLPEDHPLKRFQEAAVDFADTFFLAAKAFATIVNRASLLRLSDGTPASETQQLAFVRKCMARVTEVYCNGLWEEVAAQVEDSEDEWADEDEEDEESAPELRVKVLLDQFELLKAAFMPLSPLFGPLFESAEFLSRLLGAFERNNISVEVYSPLPATLDAFLAAIKNHEDGNTDAATHPLLGSAVQKPSAKPITVTSSLPVVSSTLPALDLTEDSLLLPSEFPPTALVHFIHGVSNMRLPRFRATPVAEGQSVPASLNDVIPSVPAGHVDCTPRPCAPKIAQAAIHQSLLAAPTAAEATHKLSPHANVTTSPVPSAPPPPPPSPCFNLHSTDPSPTVPALPSIGSAALPIDGEIPCGPTAGVEILSGPKAGQVLPVEMVAANPTLQLRSQPAIDSFTRVVQDVVEQEVKAGKAATAAEVVKKMLRECEDVLRMKEVSFRLDWTAEAEGAGAEDDEDEDDEEEDFDEVESDDEDEEEDGHCHEDHEHTGHCAHKHGESCCSHDHGDGHHHHHNKSSKGQDETEEEKEMKKLVAMVEEVAQEEWRELVSFQWPSMHGTGFFHTVSLTNHSCDPNISYEFDLGCETVTMVALKSIKAGDEILMSYLGADEIEEDLAVRRGTLEEWGFFCECARCVKEEYEEMMRKMKSKKKVVAGGKRR